MAKLKRGVIFTVSIFLIMSLVLTLTVLMYRNTQKNERRLLELGSMGRVYDIDRSIQQGLRNIFEQEEINEIDLGINGLEVYFEEKFPKEKGGEGDARHKAWKDQMKGFKKYVEGEEPEDIELRLDEDLYLDEFKLGKLKDHLLLVIKPHDIVYKQEEYPGNKLWVIPEELNFNKYRIEITTPNKVDDEDCEFNSKDGDFQVEIIVNAAGEGCSFSDSIDPCQKSKFKITERKEIGGDEQYRDIEIEIKKEDEICGILKIKKYEEVWQALDDTVRITLTVNDLEEPIKITYPDDIIDINIIDLGISKVGTLKLL